MTFTIYQVIGLVIAILAALWAVKKLIKHYATKYIFNSMERNRICMVCIAKDKFEIKKNAEWNLIHAGTITVICNQCKQQFFPGALGEEAEETKMLIKYKSPTKVQNDKIDSNSL